MFTRVARDTFFSGPTSIETQLESRCRNQSRFHAARRPHEENLRGMPDHQFVRDRQRRNNVTTRSAACNEYAKICVSSFDAHSPMVLPREAETFAALDNRELRWLTAVQHPVPVG